MAKVRELSSLIHGKYDTEAQFARELGWKRQRLNRITNGQKEPDLSEASAIASALNVPIERIADIFLGTKSPNGQQKQMRSQ